MERKPSRAADALYLFFNVLWAWFWILAVLYAFLLGGVSGPPDFERSTPIEYVYVMASGILGAMAGIAAGSIGYIDGKTVKALPVCSAVLAGVGAVPLFVMGIIAPGMILLLLSVLSASLYLLATRKRGNSMNG